MHYLSELVEGGDETAKHLLACAYRPHVATMNDDREPSGLMVRDSLVIEVKNIRLQATSV